MKKFFDIIQEELILLFSKESLMHLKMYVPKVLIILNNNPY